MNAPEAVYRHDLALVHHRGFGFHAAACAPGILDLLASVYARRGLVLELGCGSGLLTKWGRARADTPHFADAGEDWAIITKFSMPTADRFIRDITTFLPNPDGSWRRGTEHHENVLIDTTRIPALLRQCGVEAQVGPSFGIESNLPGLRVITGHKHQAG